MAGAAYPKPDNERQRRNAPTFDWVKLPESGNTKPAPPMPKGTWFRSTLDWWAQHWSHPCALMWRADDPAHARLAWIQDQVAGGTASVGLMSEARQLEDRLGLNPKARLQLRWMIVPDHLATMGSRPMEPLAVVKQIKAETRADPRLA